jgi:hypothetical protein
VAAFEGLNKFKMVAVAMETKVHGYDMISDGMVYFWSQLC